MTRRAKAWADLLTAWEQSGLSQAEFCRRRGVNGGTFAWWKRRLRGGSRGLSKPRAGAPQAREPFVELRLRGPVWGPAYEVVVAGGRSIRLSAAFDPEVLSRLIAVVESC